MNVTFTDKSIEHFTRRISSSNTSIRLYIKKVGCSGYSYKLEQTKDISDNDIKCHYKGITYYVAFENSFFWNGTTIDCISEGLNKKITFINSSREGTCGCGISFSQ